MFCFSFTSAHVINSRVTLTAVNRKICENEKILEKLENCMELHPSF